MSANRFFTFLVLMALAAVAALTFQEAIATASAVSDINSATHSYTLWAKAAESESNAVDSATHSYIAWAQAAASKSQKLVDLSLPPRPQFSHLSERTFVPITGSNASNSATRSYTAWARSAECGLAKDKTMDSATRSYTAWAKVLEVGEICK